MSIVGNIYHAISTMLGGDSCMICGGYADSQTHHVCTRCRLSIPLTRYYLEEENPVKDRFSSFAPIQHASALYFYDSDPLWREVIHRSKYRGQWRLAYTMGRWYGEVLRDTRLYDDVDIILPIPLHPIKILKRGYNQSAYIAEGLAKEMDVKVDLRSVRRVENNPSQTTKSGTSRWENVEHIFRVCQPDRLQGRHILIVDDVLTTGATIASCITAIYNAVPDCKISVVALATPGEYTLK